MPYKTKQKKIKPTDDLPQNLAHKPVYALPYEHFDGFYAGETDARFISVGLAQYDKNEVSVKIFRHTGEKWTRQSEELPLHRAIDAVTFLTRAIFGTGDGNAVFQANTFENQDESLEISRENRTSRELTKFHRFISENEDLLKARLNSLYELLDELKEQKIF